MSEGNENLVPLLPVEALRSLRRADKKLYRALQQVCGRVAAQVVRDGPQDLLLWLYLTSDVWAAFVAGAKEGQRYPTAPETRSQPRRRYVKLREILGDE